MRDLVKVVRENWDEIVAWTKTTFAKARDLVSDYLELIRTVVSRVLDGVRAFWNRWGSDIIALAKNAFKTVSGVISGALDVIQGIIRTVTAIIKGDWSGAWEGIKQILRGALDVIVSLVKGLGGMLKIVASAAFDLMRDAIRAGIDRGVELVKAMPGKVKSGLGDLGGFLLSAGEDLIRGMIQGIENMAGALLSAGKGVVGDAVSGIKGALGINSPSRVFAEIGRNVGQGMVLGLDSTSSDVRRSMVGLADPSGLDVRLPRFRATRTATSDPTLERLDQLVAAIAALPRQYRLNDRSAWS